VEECGPCPVFASFTLAFPLQLKKKHGKTCQGKKNLSQVKKNLSQNNFKQCSDFISGFKAVFICNVIIL
jgi:hypothetical protein